MRIPSFFRHSLSRHAGDKAADGPAGIARKNELSAFDAAMEDETRARAAYLDQVETLTGVRPPEP